MMVYNRWSGCDEVHHAIYTLYTAHAIKCDYCISGTLVGGVSALAVLLFISVTINILAMIYYVYQLRGKLTQCHCVSGGDGDNVDQMYEQVDEKQEQ